MTSAAAELDATGFLTGIYLDASATTPPRPEVIERIRQVQLTAWGNPSSLHQQGLAAAEVMERSRQTIARILQAKSDQLVFTSGATESIHLALLGIAMARPVGRLVISAVEHPAVNA
ncbi:MAG TPA: aminotransferase class V-fold PLP-dependent enzyme, partial [Prochlorococcaceae cyanobacterium Fu_MAG_50]|nr:aminotransferase class V-fold PLP-dependent enzyme [Prochlorococcaceae cyanobacterium Fu_MAG_50]